MTMQIYWTLWRNISNADDCNLSDSHHPTRTGPRKQSTFLLTNPHGQ